MTNQCNIILEDFECEYVSKIRIMQKELSGSHKMVVLTLKPDEILLNETSNRGRVTLRRRNGHRSGN